jgi:hypothetical protein
LVVVRLLPMKRMETDLLDGATGSLSVEELPV